MRNFHRSRSLAFYYMKDVIGDMVVQWVVSLVSRVPGSMLNWHLGSFGYAKFLMNVLKHVYMVAYNGLASDPGCTPTSHPMFPGWLKKNMSFNYNNAVVMKYKF